ncbi:hypothetical protein SCHPADRAFT_158557 [Schizopora paradoxa]|uniref:Uncharacterized protein n=1 Tax=Schizopora paradoxa TaxID=27342 RepID=A0A0H2S0N0_9AGAM|nr:hypothetical protein SCHPADRAFT_158557 [Schizopora paradoxa]
MSLTTCRRAITSYSPTFIHGSSKQVIRPKVRRTPFRALSVESSTTSTSSTSDTTKDEALRDGIQNELSEIQDFLKSMGNPVEEVKEISSSSRIRRPRSRRRSKRSVIIFRPDEYIRSMPMALAILQEAEARYGRAVEFKFPRDKELPVIYQPFFWGVFDGMDVDEKNAIAQSFATSIPSLNVPKVQLDGNVGLIDILPYLRRKEQEATQPPSENPLQSPPPSQETSIQNPNDEDKMSPSNERRTPFLKAVDEGEDGMASASEKDDEPSVHVSGDRIVHTRTEHSTRESHPCLLFFHWQLTSHIA